LLLWFSAHAPFIAALAVESRVLNPIPIESFSSLRDVQTQNPAAAEIRRRRRRTIEPGFLNPQLLYFVRASSQAAEKVWFRIRASL
jgi:hypothetical protein